MLVAGICFGKVTTMAEDKHRDADIAEIRAELRDASRLLKEHVSESKARSEDFDRKLIDSKKQSDDYKRQQEKRSREIDAQLKELGKQIGGAHNRWGKIIEELVAGDLTAIVHTHLHAHAHHLSTRVRAADRSWEIDLLATNGDIAVPAEVKTTLNKDDIDNFVSRILVPFTTLLPDHQHKRIYGVIAFVKIDGNESKIIDYALQQGLILVKAMDGTNKVLNPKNFKPRNFCPRHR